MHRSDTASFAAKKPSITRYALKVNGFEMCGWRLRRCESMRFELVVRDVVIGEFALDGTEHLEVKDRILTNALRGLKPATCWRRATLEELADLLLTARTATETTQKRISGPTRQAGVEER